MTGSLSAFLSQNAKKVDNVKYVASPRFAEEGVPVEWEIRCITAAENTAIRRLCVRTVAVTGKKGQYTSEFDANAYLAKVAVRCTVYPNLSDAELQNSYGAMGAEQLVATMLTPGEFEDYTTKILETNGFQTPAEMEDDAKN